MLREAEAHAPDDPALSVTLGRLLVSDRQADVAVGVFRRGLAAHPQDAALLVGLGVALDLQGDPSEAQVNYTKALALEPDSTSARNDLALSLGLSNHSDEAIRRLQALRRDLLETGTASEQIATIDGNLALVYGISGDVREAIQAGRASLKPADLASNARFYSALAAGASARSGAEDASGFAPPAAPAPPESAPAATSGDTTLPDAD